MLDGDLHHRHHVSHLDSEMKHLKIAMLCLAVGSLTSCSQADSNHAALEKKVIKCPAGSQFEYSPWGKSGLVARCVVLVGPTVMAENGHVVIEGQYDNGKQAGEWRWLDKSGKVVRSEIQK
jgi:hypothetical protein